MSGIASILPSRWKSTSSATVPISCKATCNRAERGAGAEGASVLFGAQCHDAVFRAEQADVGRAAGEQAAGDDAGQLVDAPFQIDRVENLQAMHVENEVAVVGDE